MIDKVNVVNKINEYIQELIVETDEGGEANDINNNAIQLFQELEMNVDAGVDLDLEMSQINETVYLLSLHRKKFEVLLNKYQIL